MLTWVLIALAVVAAGLAIGARRRALPARTSERTTWSEVVSEAVRGGAVRTGPTGIRAFGATGRWSIEVETDAGTDTLRIQSERLPAEGRLFVGWNVDDAPATVAHWPTVAVRPPDGTGRFDVRAEPDFGVQSWLDEAYVDLLDLGTQTGAHAVELILGGGYLKLRLGGARPAPGLWAPVVEAADRLARSLTPGPVD